MRLFGFGKRLARDAKAKASTATILCARLSRYTALADEDHDARSLRVMCGLHTGLVYTHGRHIVSSSIGTAQWVSTRGSGGQIFLSETTGALVRPHLGAEWALKKCSDPVGDNWTDFCLLMSAEDYSREHRTAFISYRRGGGAELARLVASELRRRDVETFVDLDDLGADRFDHQILRRIEATPNFVLILTPGCLDRCDEEDDWVRREIAQALKCGCNIVPVMARDFRFPPNPMLPPELSQLPGYSGVPYSHEYSHAAIERLMSFLKPARGGRPGA